MRARGFYGMIPKKPAPDLIRGIQRFSGSCSNKKLERDDGNGQKNSYLGDCRPVSDGPPATP